MSVVVQRDTVAPKARLVKGRLSAQCETRSSGAISYTCMCIYIYMCVYVCIYIHMCVYICIYIYMLYMSTYIHTHICNIYMYAQITIYIYIP